MAGLLLVLEVVATLVAEAGMFAVALPSLRLQTQVQTGASAESG